MIESDPTAELCRARRLRLVSRDPEVLAGLAALRVKLTTDESDPRGCQCDQCRDHPLSLVEADTALAHLSDNEAAAFARGGAVLSGFELCESCESWVPVLAEPAGAP